MCETADTKNKELSCLLPWIIIFSTSRRFFLLAAALPSSLPYLQWDVSATSSVRNTVINNEDLYHIWLSFSLSYYKTLSFVLSSSSSTYWAGAHSGNDIGIYWVWIPSWSIGCLTEILLGFPQFLQLSVGDITCIKSSPLAYHLMLLPSCGHLRKLTLKTTITKNNDDRFSCPSI